MKRSAQPRLKPLSPVSPSTSRPAGSGGGNGSLWFVCLLILLGLGGGGWYMHDRNQQEEAKLRAEAQAREARKREAEEARRKAEEEARRQAEEQERLKREQEEEARRQAEEEERRRREEEEEARRRAEQDAADEDDVPLPEPDEPEPEPEPEPVAGPYDAELPLTGAGVTAKETKDLYNSMIDRLASEADFEDFAEAFAKKIKAAIPEIVNNDKLNYNAYKRSKPLMQSVALCSLIRMAGADTLRSIVKPDRKTAAAAGESALGADAGSQFLLWLLRDKSEPLSTFMQGFTANGGHARNMAYHIQTLYELWTDTPEKDRAKYLNLAVACALVEPGRAKSDSQAKTGRPALSIRQVYAYFREMDAKKKLLTDVKKMDVSDLLFVVDVRLPQSEFDWVHQNLNYSQAQWGQAYGSIRYRMDVVAGTAGKIYNKYTFAEIRKEGGICMNQAYFANTTAKCKGIPAVYITGDGDRGGHAWIASMVDNISWKQTGSYGYNTGRFSNPCSGRAMHESVLLNQTKKTTDDKQATAYEGMLLAEHLVSIGSTAEARSTARYVTGAFPLLTVAWTSRINVLTADEEDMPDADYWRKLSSELTRHGKKNPELLDLASEVDNNYALEGKSDTAKRTAMKRSLDKLKRTVGNERSDLLLEATDRQGALLAEEKDIRGLANLYNKLLKENTKRGDVFAALLRQYIKHMQKAEATKKDWTAMAKATEKIFEKGVLTNTTDHFKLKKEVEVQKIIADIYAKAENEKKATKLKESADQRLQESKERNG